MFDRRRLARFTVTPAAEGTLFTVNEILFRHAGNDEWLAIGHDPLVEGEIVGLEFGDDETAMRIMVRVLESRPVVIDGAVRYQMRLGGRISQDLEDSPWPPRNA